MEKIQPAVHIADKEFLSNALTTYVENEFSFALWRLPESTAVHLAACESPRLGFEGTLEDSKPGFIFSPFDPTRKKIFLPADELYTFEGGQLTSGNGTALEAVYQKNEKKINQGGTRYHSSPQSPMASNAAREFQSIVRDCKEAISQGHFEKIVPSRIKKVELPTGFDLVESFNQICQLYPHAMVSIVSCPLTGTWVGATPEMLVSVSRGQHFHTVAIAGTQAFTEGMDLKAISWTQKDIEEQALVERYIISCFKKIRLREYEEHGPKTIVAGNVIHLKTDFEVDMVATNFPQLGSTMLQLLHPTSAVCGMPLQASLDFLKKNEGYDRQFYSGYLGPVNVFQESNIYVNLRCMQLFENEAILYAGAGVLADSDPEKELRETEMKMNTLLRIINK